MRIWEYKTRDYRDNSNSFSSTVYDRGYVIAETMKEAYDKIVEHEKEAWGKIIRFEITKLEYQHEINIP
jgi:hypothetical protein